jgi:hypothetical protein
MELDSDIWKFCLSTDILSEYTIKRQHNFPSQWHFKALIENTQDFGVSRDQKPGYEVGNTCAKSERMFLECRVI